MIFITHCKLVYWWKMMHADFRSTYFLYIDYFFKNLNTLWFISTRNMLYFYLLLTKFVANWFFPSWNIYIVFFLIKLILFVALIARWVFSWNSIYLDFLWNMMNLFLFVKIVPYGLFYPFKKLNTFWFISSRDVLHFILNKPVLFMELFPCWF